MNSANSTHAAPLDQLRESLMAFKSLTILLVLAAAIRILAAGRQSSSPSNVP
ncbi:MAG: hypothetical protein U0132_23830 [Gemmatimonadaceae bacterium]